jgi:DNA-directed RNA polymerase specialized sigma24 family protein
MEAEEGDRGERRAPREDEHEKLVNELYTELYGELYERARRWKRTQPKSVTLETTGLVHDACLKFLDREDLVHLDRTHVLALAATAMRHVLVDRARARRRRRSPAEPSSAPPSSRSTTGKDATRCCSASPSVTGPVAESSATERRRRCKET